MGNGTTVLIMIFLLIMSSLVGGETGYLVCTGLILVYFIYDIYKVMWLYKKKSYDIIDYWHDKSQGKR